MFRKWLLAGLISVLGISSSLMGASPLEQDSGPDGMVSVEAEHYDEIISHDPYTWLFVTEMSDGFIPPDGWSGEGAMQSQPTQLAGGAGFQGTDFTSTSTGLNFQVNFVKTGTHYIWILARGMDGNSDSGHATLDGEENTTAYRIDGWNNSYSWRTNMMESAGVATLEVPSLGVHTVGIWMREDGLTVDKIVLTTNPDYTPTGQGPPESHRGQSFGASNPLPESGEADVLRDVTLTWTPGPFAQTHHVYFGETLEDVNSATVPTSIQDTSEFSPGRLEFLKTFYWRVDEVNGTPDKTVFQGSVWSFQVEPYSITVPINIDHVTASSAVPTNTPDMTVNGSGLSGMTHSAAGEAMWLSASPDLNPWLMYEFDKPQKLDQMWVWNSNSMSEAFIGWGIKEVNIETSVDGVDWTVLAGPHEISRAPGSPGYDTPQVIDFGLVQAKYVKINILNNWGGLLTQFGVSEVQFYALPTVARTPNPASGTQGVDPRSEMLSWRSGREADQHDVFLSTDPADMGQAQTVLDNRLALSSLDVSLDNTYYWQVNEVNETMVPSTWAGDLWSFTTMSSFVVDDFESYTNISPNRPFQAWLDGYGYSADEFFPVTYAGNGTGAGIGHDIWSPSSPYFDSSLMETTSTLTGSSQSMPFYYNNAGSVASKTERLFAEPQDWTIGKAKTLSIAFRGKKGNTGTLFAMINNTKVTYAKVPDSGLWHYFNIDLSTVNTNLQSVTKLTIGIDGSNASGMILIDDIRLYLDAGPADPGSSGLPLIAWVSFHGDDNVPSTAAAAAGFAEAPDKTYTDLLTAHGYEVIRYVTTSTPDPDVLGAVDLVIISRSVASGGYQDAGATAWNTIDTPMIITGGYTLRNSRMGFTTGDTIPDTAGDITLKVNNPSHPIFAGIQLSGGTMVNPFAGLAVYPTDGTTVSRGISVNTDPLDDDGILLATVATASDPAAGGMVIGEWQAGAVLKHVGGEIADTLSSHRLVFLTGSRETSGISGDTAGLYDLYEDGEQMLLNAVEYMLLP